MTFTHKTSTLHLKNLISRGNRSLYRIIMLLTIHQFTLSQCASMTNFIHCWRCDDFNRQSNGQCANDYKDCGDCKPGFIQDEEDPRLCFAVENLEDPGKDIVQRTGSEVILNCIFNAKVWCVWTKDTNQVVIDSSSRYLYLSSDAEYSKKYDCSIKIKPLSMDDIGRWQCQSMAEDNIESVKGRPTQISIEHDDAALIPTIKLNDGNVSGREINANELQSITRRRRGLNEDKSVLECEVTLTPSELRWEINGNVIVGGKLNDKQIQLDRNHLETVETYVSQAIKLTCLVEYDSGQRFTSYVIIRPEAEIDSNSSKSYDSDLHESRNVFENIYAQPIPMSILVTSGILSIMLVTFLIAAIVVIYKLSQLKNEKRNKLIIEG